jgi:hypothetical protein
LRPEKKIKSLEEVQVKDEKVQAKIMNIQIKRQRGPNEGSAARQAAKQQKRLDTRNEIMLQWVP